MNLAYKGELASVLLGLSFQVTAFQLPPEDWGYAVLLLLAGALFGASVAAYAGKRMGLEEAADGVFAKMMLNVSIVGMFGPAALGWWIDATGMQLEASAPMVGGIIAMFGVTTLIIFVPKITGLLRRINIFKLLGKASAVIEPEKPQQNPQAPNQ